MRKDVLLATVRVFKNLHSKTYSSEHICKLTDGSQVFTTESSLVDKNLNLLRKDLVGNIVVDYSAYETKIESIAQLRFAANSSIRAEIAMLNLGRSYVARCVSRNGNWKSGIHILWWVKEFFKKPMPEITANDIIYHTTAKLERQIELAKWSILLLRLTYISDIGDHAKATGDSSIGELCDIAEEAALATETPSFRKLDRWIRNEGLNKIDRVLPEATYREISVSLHKE